MITVSAAGTGFVHDELMDAVVIPFNRTLPITNTPTSLMLYGGLQQTTLASLRYKISSDCSSNQYGKDCEIECLIQGRTCNFCNYLGETVCLKESSDPSVSSFQKGSKAAIERGKYMQ